MSSPINKPEVVLDIVGAQQTVPDTATKVLFVGQMKTGTATAGQLVEQIGSQGEEDTYFGRNSFLAGMIRAARLINKSTRFDAIPLADNGSGVAATATIAFTGPASVDGTLSFVIGSAINYSFDLPITIGETATQIGAALIAIINANLDIPVTATADTGTVTLTADNKGTIGNFIGLAMTGSVTGVAATLTGFASGATDPVLTTVFDPIADQRYQIIVWPCTYSKTTVINYLDGEFNSGNKILDGRAFTSNSATYANHITALGSLNSKSLLYLCNALESDANKFLGPAIMELDDIIASQLAAISALRLTDGADLSRYVISNNAGDNFGGMQLASLPYHNTPFYDLPVIATKYGFDSDEQDALNAAGGSVLGNNITNNQLIAGDLFMTYKTNVAGDPDSSFKYLNYVETQSVIREFYVNNIRANYRQYRLTTGAIMPDMNMVNAGGIKAFIVSLYQQLAQLGLVQAGTAALNYFRDNLQVIITDASYAAGRVEVTMPNPIVVQFRDMNPGLLKLVFENFGS